MAPAVRSARPQSKLTAMIICVLTSKCRTTSKGQADSQPASTPTGNGNFCCGDWGAKIGSRDLWRPQRPGPGTRPANMAEETALLGVCLEAGISGRLDGGDGRDRTATPHPLIEPVSDIRVRNGNFRCRDGSVNTAVPPLSVCPKSSCII